MALVDGTSHATIVTKDQARANLERAVACVNALAAFPNLQEAVITRRGQPLAEEAQRQRYLTYGPDLVRALEQMIPDTLLDNGGYVPPSVCHARTLLEKVTGTCTEGGAGTVT